MTKSSHRAASDAAAARDLTAIEINSVSGGATHKAYDFWAGGLHYVGGYTDGGDYFSWVQDAKNNLTLSTGKV